MGDMVLATTTSNVTAYVRTPAGEHDGCMRAALRDISTNANAPYTDCNSQDTARIATRTDHATILDEVTRLVCESYDGSGHVSERIGRLVECEGMARMAGVTEDELKRAEANGKEAFWKRCERRFGIRLGI